VSGFDVELVRDQARVFPPRPLSSGLRSLQIWHCRYATLAPLSQFRSLRILSIDGFPDPTLDTIGLLTELEWLSILHLPKVTTLAPLRHLSRLRCLSLRTTPGWDASSKKTIVESLSPIADLPALEHLELFGVVPADGSLAELQRAKSLRSVRVSKYRASEQARFRSETSLPNNFMPDPAFT
jgi:hypothetical protein